MKNIRMTTSYAPSDLNVNAKWRSEKISRATNLEINLPEDLL